MKNSIIGKPKDTDPRDSQGWSCRDPIVNLSSLSLYTIMAYLNKSFIVRE